MFIRKKRLENGWTQSHVAEKLEVSERFYRSIEAGHKKPSYENIIKIEDLFNLPQRVLFCEDVHKLPDIYKPFINLNFLIQKQV